MAGYKPEISEASTVNRWLGSTIPRQSRSCPSKSTSPISPRHMKDRLLASSSAHGSNAAEEHATMVAVDNPTSLHAALAPGSVPGRLLDDLHLADKHLRRLIYLTLIYLTSGSRRSSCSDEVLRLNHRGVTHMERGPRTTHMERCNERSAGSNAGTARCNAMLWPSRRFKGQRVAFHHNMPGRVWYCTTTSMYSMYLIRYTVLDTTVQRTGT